MRCPIHSARMSFPEQHGLMEQQHQEGIEELKHKKYAAQELPGDFLPSALFVTLVFEHYGRWGGKKLRNIYGASQCCHVTKMGEQCITVYNVLASALLNPTTVLQRKRFGKKDVQAAGTLSNADRRSGTVFSIC